MSSEPDRHRLMLAGLGYYLNCEHRQWEYLPGFPAALSSHSRSPELRAESHGEGLCSTDSSFSFLFPDALSLRLHVRIRAGSDPYLWLRKLFRQSPKTAKTVKDELNISA